MSRHELWEAMLQRKHVMLSGVTGLINSIEMEDGSGQCFNVAMCENETLETKTAFRLEIEKYNAAKAAQCKIWGCE